MGWTFVDWLIAWLLACGLGCFGWFGQCACLRVRLCSGFLFGVGLVAVWLVFFVVAFCGWWVCLLACWLAGSLAFAAQKMMPMGTHGSEIDAIAHWQVRRRCSWAIAIQKLMPMGISSAAKPPKTTSEILATRSEFQIQSPNAIPSAQRSRMCRVMPVSYVLAICAAPICAIT